MLFTLFIIVSPCRAGLHQNVVAFHRSFIQLPVYILCTDEGMLCWGGHASPGRRNNTHIPLLIPYPVAAARPVCSKCRGSIWFNTPRSLGIFLWPFTFGLAESHYVRSEWSGRCLHANPFHCAGANHWPHRPLQWLKICTGGALLELMPQFMSRMKFFACSSSDRRKTRMWSSCGSRLFLVRSDVIIAEEITGGRRANHAACKPHEIGVHMNRRRDVEVLEDRTRRPAVPDAQQLVELLMGAPAGTSVQKKKNRVKVYTTKTNTRP